MFRNYNSMGLRAVFYTIIWLVYNFDVRKMKNIKLKFIYLWSDKVNNKQ